MQRQRHSELGTGYRQQGTGTKDSSVSRVTKAVYRLVAASLIILLCMAPAAWAGDDGDMEKEGFYDRLGDRKWALTVYGGKLAEETIEDIYTFSATFDTPAYLVTAALARRMASFFDDGLIFELEGQVTKHFDYMDHWELNGLGIFRLPLFSRSEVLNMSLAWGGGLSLASEIPRVEEEEAIRDDEDANELLFYMLVELTFNIPKAPQWNLVFRLHHRSGAAGTLGEVGSNFVCAGFKYYF
jgi:hypothetical protein